MAAPAVLSTAPTAAKRQLWRFGLVSSAGVLLWAIGAIYGLGADSRLDDLLCQQLAASSAWGLRAGGWLASVAPTNLRLLLLDGRPSVIVGAPCDGLVLYFLLAGFVLAYPGPGLRRWWFIPLGIGALWLLNVVRIMVLALNHQYSPETFDFDHHYAFNVVAYSALGGLWLLWTRQSAPAFSTAAADFLPSPTAPGTEVSWLTPRLVAGALLLAGLALTSIFQANAVASLSAGWATVLASGPAWLHRVPGAAPGDVPAGVSHLALPVGLAFTGLFLGTSLLVLYLLLPARNWRLVWRSYAGIGLACGLLLLLGRAGGGAATYRLGRMLLDFLVSLMPVVGLLILLWRPTTATTAHLGATAVSG